MEPDRPDENNELLTQVVKMLRARHAASSERLRKNKAEEDALTDEEWWERRQRSLGSNPMLLDQLEQMKEQMLLLRKERREFLSKGDDVDKIYHERAEALLPYVVRVREELGDEGPLTEAHFQSAYLLKHQAERVSRPEYFDRLNTLLGRIREGAARATDPKKQQVLNALGENVAQDIEDVRSLKSPNLTEQDLERVTENICAQMRALTEVIRERPPE